MNALIISYSDSGGAGSAALRLYRNIKNQNNNTMLLVNKKATKDSGVISFRNKIYHFVQKITEVANRRIMRVKSLLNIPFTSTRDAKYYFFSTDISKKSIPLQTIKRKIIFQPDVIIVCFVGNSINIELVYELHKWTGASIIWYLFDMEFLTGGCHYSWGCKGYTKMCGNCPALYSSESNDYSQRNIRFKIDYAIRMPMIVASGSEWLFRQCNESTIAHGARTYKVLLAVDPDIFRPTGKKEARSKFGLDSSSKVIYFGASSLNEERKGMKYLLETLMIVKRRVDHTDLSIILIIAGSARGFPFNDIPFSYKHVGILKGERELASAYQAADVFVCPSIEDSGPMMINESIMSGTPVVSFNMGVAHDLVHNGITGYRAELRNCEDLANGLLDILTLNEHDHLKMKKECRNLGLKLCHPDVQAKAFQQIYTNALASKEALRSFDDSD